MCDCTDHKDEIPAYDAQAIESRWMKAWEDSNLFAVDTDDSKPKKYVLEMFPYPSGDLHMGHARNYTIGDAMARQARMRGYDVLHPIGFDAFGLPAENAAIKHNTQAAAWTYKNMDQALATMKRMGFSYDLDRMVKTCSPDYYRWGQWIFEKLWEKGLVYRKKNPVNWCPNCKTVLANEQVTEGKCWRCGTEPEKRDLEQWYFKITEYSQELLDDLEKLPGWPERVKQMQANWIGRSEAPRSTLPCATRMASPSRAMRARSPSSPRVPIPFLASPSLSWLPSTPACTSSSRARSTRRPSLRLSRTPSTSLPSSVPRAPSRSTVPSRAAMW